MVDITVIDHILQHSKKFLNCLIAFVFYIVYTVVTELYFQYVGINLCGEKYGKREQKGF